MSPGKAESHAQHSVNVPCHPSLVSPVWWLGEDVGAIWKLYSQGHCAFIQQQLLEPKCTKHRAGSEDGLENENNPLLMVLPQSEAR